MQVRGSSVPPWLRRMRRYGSSAADTIDLPEGSARPPLAQEAVAPVEVRTPWTPTTALIVTLLAAVAPQPAPVTRFVPAVGEFIVLPGSAGDLVRTWAGGYRPVGLGADASVPTLAGVAGGLGAVLSGTWPSPARCWSSASCRSA